MSDKDIDQATGVDTTGHEWDGIKELNNPFPRWWLWCLYLTIVWGIGYMIAYLAWPLVKGATTGVLGYSTRAEVQVDIDRFKAQNAELETALASVDLESLSDNSELNHFAVASGGAVFRSHCSQCHGSGAAGGKGYPNLLDDDWLWGGTIDEIAFTVNHGVRNETDSDARYSEMPDFSEFLEPGEIDAVTNHVMKISGQDHDAARATQGAVVFEDQCSACHAGDGSGDRDQGAPNLTDAIWLYGGDPASVQTSITNPWFGIMPAWGPRLSPSQVNAVAAFVHQLGGGE